MLLPAGIKTVLRLMIIDIIIIMILIKSSYSLRCRTDDGPSDGEMKRVARTCMRKFGDIAIAQNAQQQHQQQSQGRLRQRLRNRENYGYNYEESDEDNDEDFDEDQYYYNNNQRNNHNHRQQNGNNNNNERGGNNGGGYNDDRQRGRSRYNGNNNNNSNNRTSNGNNNNSNNWNYSNQTNNLGNSNSNRGNNNNNNNNNNRNKNNNNNNQNNQNSSSDPACIVHCFFDEMHMLNNNNYPDRHKMLYILTKDLRDRELRNFYTDTIQECFRYLENQRRRDKCQFSRDLITCMTEYAKGNCEDWNEFNMMFN